MSFNTSQHRTFCKLAAGYRITPSSPVLLPQFVRESRHQVDHNLGFGHAQWARPITSAPRGMLFNYGKCRLPRMRKPRFSPASPKKQKPRPLVCGLGELH